MAIKMCMISFLTRLYGVCCRHLMEYKKASVAFGRIEVSA
jgi:hypothetical protein